MLTKRDFDFYMKVNYRVEVEPSPEGGFIAKVVKVPGCSQEDILDDALGVLATAKEAWITRAFQAELARLGLIPNKKEE